MVDWDKVSRAGTPTLDQSIQHGAPNDVLRWPVEIVARLVVLLLPRIGGYLIALWLAGIIVKLALIGGYWDMMMRDAAQCLLALTFARTPFRRVSRLDAYPIDCYPAHDAAAGPEH